MLHDIQQKIVTKNKGTFKTPPFELCTLVQIVILLEKK